ncbi:STAS/SEC14 domain-containing protein [Modicisalibacter tunisiensis]|uniref:STAS/SEC14 domain-containing protein n=1 Tax=Modicisalibacter tunisiensis TaxID=390637 RepID=A0ABS7X1U0_9GAMM|nr:STAS/SEC14 domain-containing protein [Modicisalibacter tunisiensis]MBZ9537724.1 STAS/SEC14 domain-containing protein [Modicisalibacter tunisiensis]MBZ9568857.1 STAS/SEC14 domain-containing protein [Modicisalibacter tunisiensis]
MLEWIDTPAPHVLAMRLGGRLDADELQSIIDAIETAKTLHPRISLYLELDALRSMTPPALLRDIGYGLTQVGQLEHFHHVAIISDQHWLRPVAALESRLFAPLTVRVFTNHQQQAAMDWASELPGRPAPAAPNRRAG